MFWFSGWRGSWRPGRCGGKVTALPTLLCRETHFSVKRGKGAKRMVINDSLAYAVTGPLAWRMKSQ